MLDPPAANSIASAVRTLQPIADGLRSPLGDEHKRTLVKVLAPLFGNDEMLDDATCALSVYMKPLCTVVRTMLRKLSVDDHREVAGATFDVLIGGWCKANSRHGAAMVSSFEEMLEEIDGDVWEDIRKDLLRRIGECIVSENSLLATRALGMFKQDAFLALLARSPAPVIASLAPALFRNGQTHWDPEVNGMLSATIDLICAMGERESAVLRTAGIRYMRKRRRDSKEAEEDLDKYLETLRADRNVREDQRERMRQLEQERSRMPDRMPLPKAVDNHLHFVFGRILGRGSYSAVKYARRIEMDVPQKMWRDYACKVISKEHVKLTDAEQQIQQELRLLAELDHPLISPLFATFQDDRNLYVVMEYCARGDLFAVLFEKGGIAVASAEWIRFVLAEIASALAHVQGKNYMYGDLKPENVLLTGSGHTRLCDFGSCKSEEQLDQIRKRWACGERSLQRDLQGTAEYLPPEVVSFRDVGMAADWWSFGVTAFQLMCGHMPFAAESQSGLFRLITAASPLYPPTMPRPATELVERLLSTSAESRPQLPELQSSEYFKGISFDGISETQPPFIDLGRVPGNAGATLRRHYSMFWAPDGGSARPEAPVDVTAFAAAEEETDQNSGWDQEQPPPPEAAGASAAAEQRVEQKATVAKMGSSLEDYVSTVPWAKGRGGRPAVRRASRKQRAPDPNDSTLEEWVCGR
eukprot:TRINITY_DN13744_c0_g1_i1.p1 TRINITY_DN13744_c0_g1~~TRINITY_DN13744_c0_g1_i1.p1  ORF type:complete len:697 (+),score=204.04 TRINITY_DN13744_c0_g1_i1:735-2825(+)